MRCLVTGIAGFAGSHLAELLVSQGHHITGVALPGEDLSRLDSVRSLIDVRLADVSDAAALSGALTGVEPDWAFHLAALASVPASLADPAAAVRVNVLGTANLLEALKRSGVRRVVCISSADVYGRAAPCDMPLAETHALKPANPYAASKAAAEVLISQYWRTYALPVVVLRPFNHTGPRQGPGFAPSDFARAIARIEKGLGEERMAVGNLESRRDYSDVRDIVRAYVDAALYGEPGETYNVSSGSAVRIGELLDILLAASKAAIEVVSDPAKARPSDTPVVVGNNRKFTRRTGWSPRSLDLAKTLGDLLDWWREQA